MIRLAVFASFWFGLVLSISHDPEIRLNTPEIVSYWGYPVETVNAITEDGYILEMHRILGGRNASAEGRTDKPVVFMQHGLEDCSSTWVANLPEQSAGFLFADAGFDVWLGNVRGNTYGRRHVTLNPLFRKFWEFSWDQMVEYDLPAMVDVVLAKTGQKTLYYVGHSQGTLIMSAKLSSDPSFAAKIKKFFALAPVSTVGHIKGLFRLLASPLYLTLSSLESVFGSREFLPLKSFLRLASNVVCAQNPGNELCSNVMFLVGGPISHQFNRSRLPVYLAHSPAGTSTQNMLHWAQMVPTGRMLKYSHRNPFDNLRKYGSFFPPVYDLSMIATDTYLFWSDSDWLACSADIAQSFLSDLKPAILKGNTKLHDFNHFDFVWGLRAAEEVYKPIIEVIRRDLKD